MTVVVDGRTLVKFVMQIDERPSWVEISMLTRLERKLRSELGTPAPPPSKKPDDKDKPEDDKPAPPKNPKDEPKKPDEGGPPISDKP